MRERLVRLLRRHGVTVLIAALVAFFASQIWPPERTPRHLATYLIPLHQLEWRGYDLLFNWRGARREPVDPRIVVVGYDRDTEQSLEDNHRIMQWPPPRRYHARVLENLVRDGARVVVFDLLFSTPSGYGAGDDRALHDALRRARCPVILACRVNRDHAEQRKSLEAPYYDDARGIDFEHSAKIGFTEIVRDRDDVVRWMLPIQKFQDEWLPSLASAAFLALTDGEVDRSRLTAKTIFVGDQPVPRTGPTTPDPVSPETELALTYVNFPGGNAAVPLYRYEQVARGQFAPGSFAGKVVFVGITGTELAKQTGDQHRTAYSSLTPERSGGIESRDVFGVIIQAQFLDALIHGHFIAHAAPLQTGLFVFGLMLIAAVGVRGYVDWRGPALVLTALLLYISLVLVCFENLRLYIPWVIPSSTMVVVIGAISFTDRAKLRQMWGRYVSKAYLEVMLREGYDQRPERVTASVLFADIRGFTAFSERHAPEKVVELLDKHLEKLIHIVFEEDGTIDKFLGDGLMVVFGAPRLRGAERSEAENARRAVQTAWRMLEVSNDPVLDEEGVPFTFAMGVGVATGPLVCGHVGTKDLVTLTLIGDTVNLASRLQTITGEADIVIDEPTCAFVAGVATVESLGVRDVKGKEQGVLCFRVTGFDGAAGGGSEAPRGRFARGWPRREGESSKAANS